MDKNTIVGFLLIGLILIGFSWLNQPSEEQLAAKRTTDSIAAVEYMRQAQVEQQAMQQLRDSIATNPIKSDSVRHQSHGLFAPLTQGTDTLYTLKNNLLQLTLSAKGAAPNSALLLDYKTHEGKPLYLFDGKEAALAFAFNTRQNQIIRTDELYFTPVVHNDSSITLRARIAANQYIDFTYILHHGNYMTDLIISSKGMNEVLAPNNSALQLTWLTKLRQQEKGRSFEERQSYLAYKYTSGDVENLSESNSDEKSLSGKVRWIGYKDQFFSTVLIAEESFTHTQLTSEPITDQSSPYLMKFASMADLPFDMTGEKPSKMNLYLGPNHYPTLRAYDKDVENNDQQLHLDQLVPMGWAIFRWISQWVVIPLFGFFGSIFSNMGIIILLLTIVIKLIIFPMTYKSYISMAKMRVVRPQVEEINTKYPGQENAMERQKHTMALYSKLGVSPMSGCLPMLLQMPILFALFAFFPSSIELRGQSFLWAQDLSTYDAIWSWNTYIPIITPYFGNHISLFCLLMTITNILNTKFNMDSQSSSTEAMPGMKMMQYMMPFMFLVFFNQYPAGLSYYYFLSTLIGILQTLAFRYFIDENKLLAKLHEKAAKNKGKKKSGFWARLENMQKEQQRNLQQKNKLKK